MRVWCSRTAPPNTPIERYSPPLIDRMSTGVGTTGCGTAVVGYEVGRRLPGDAGRRGCDGPRRSVGADAGRRAGALPDPAARPRWCRTLVGRRLRRAPEGAGGEVAPRGACGRTR